MRISPVAVLACVALTATLLTTTGAEGGSRFAYVPAAVEMTRAVQYATMSSELCLLELTERGVPFEELDEVRGVQTPIRLTGPIHGVAFVATWRPERDDEIATAILDCALALALDDLAGILAAHDVVEVQYLSMYRPGAARPGVRHPSGRAIDVAVVTTASGEELSVHRDFHGRVGKQTCGAGAAPPRRNKAGARFWRKVVCDLDALQSFNLVLTPNHDWGHRDHLHLEVRSGVRWFLTQ